MSQQNGWIGVDLDATLAHYDGWHGIEHIGAPIPAMLDRVKAWRADGIEVRVFTARVAGDDADEARPFIDAWTLEHVGEVLPVTCRKDFGMLSVWDDRAVQVIPNLGLPLEVVCEMQLAACAPVVENPGILVYLAPAKRALAAMAQALSLLPPRPEARK